MTDSTGAETAQAAEYVRVERAGDVPPANDRVIDVALLDMHHGWPNLGHDAIVDAVHAIAGELEPVLAAAGLGVRVISYDVRRSLQVPEPPGGRYGIYLGTGGPGHLDPAQNDGRREGSQGIFEDPAWEPRLFALFDHIAANDRAVLLAVCHTFGVMCRWLGAARPVERGPARGGKSAGIVDNVLSADAIGHPWFGAFARELPDGRHFRVLDNRLYDLVACDPLPAAVSALSFEAERDGGPGAALTMIEASRDAGGVMPRILGVNHHPEIVNRGRQLALLARRAARGEVTAEWVAERTRTLTQDLDPDGDRSLQLTSHYTLLGPLRFFLEREVRARI